MRSRRLNNLVRHSALHSLVLIFVVVSAALACKRKGSSSTSASSAAPSGSPRHRRELATAEVTRRFETISGFAAQVRSAEGVTGNRPLARRPERGQYAVIGDTFLEDPSREENKQELPLRSDLLSLCKKALRAEVIGEVDLEHLEECAKLEYLAVVRTKRLTPPKIKIATKTFDSGKVEGDVFVFDLPKGALVASYRIVVTNKDEIKREGGGDEEQWLGSAMRNLATRTNRAVEGLLTPND